MRTTRCLTSFWLLILGSVASLGCTRESAVSPATPPPSAQSTVPIAPGAALEPKGPELSLEALEQLGSVAELKPHVSDERVEARQIVVGRLAAVGGTEAVPLLGRLAADRDPLVAAGALTALSRMGNDASRAAAGEALQQRSSSEQDELLIVLRDHFGGPGLLALLLNLPDDPKQRWYRQKSIFTAIEQLHDPRAADGLARFVQGSPHPHYAYRAAAELAQLGDPRAVPFLAARLRQDPLELYSDKYDWEMALKRDDNERVTAARLIADLASLFPDRIATFRTQAEAALLFYIRSTPSPHANGLRALAALGSQAVLPELRAWAFPTSPLPKEGQQPPMPEEWVVAQIAQRYVGRARDPGSFQPLIANLSRRPRDLDVSMNALMGGGIAILGMSLRAIDVGAAQGLSEWGDPKAVQPLLAHARDPRNNEQSRSEACVALAWLVNESETAQIVGELVRPAPALVATDPFRRECLLSGLAQRAAHVEGRRLIGLLEPKVPDTVRATAARVIARAGIDEKLEADLKQRAHYDVAGTDAVLALVLAGSADAAVDSLKRHVGDTQEARTRLALGIRLTLDFLSREDVDRGFLFTVLRNADAAADAGHDWLQRAVANGLGRVMFDNGPHSLTRPVLRAHLLEMARSNKRFLQRKSAVRALWYLREQGSLLALANGKGPEASLARAEYEQLLKPPVACDECPADY